MGMIKLAIYNFDSFDCIHRLLFRKRKVWKNQKEETVMVKQHDEQQQFKQ